MTRLLLLLSAVAFAQAPTPQFDIVFRGGTVFDGTGAPGVRADVAVRNGHIAHVGRVPAASGATEVDARGLYVAPGFINIHSHAQPDGLPSAANMLTQGVTTEVINSDGGGPVNLREQLTMLESAGLAVNVGAFIGFNSVWSGVMGAADRAPSQDEIARMRAALLTGLQEGAWGVSSGLDYKPAYFARLEDVIAIVGAAAPWRTNFINHDRITPESDYSSRAGIAETLAIGERAGLLPVVTHMKVQGHEQGSAPEILRMMARGRYAAADAYPYLAGQSGLGALIIPGWAQAGGRQAMLERFRDPATRARIIADAERAMQLRFGGPGGVYVTTIGRELTDVMAEGQVGAGEAVVRLLETRDMGAILRFGSEPDLVAILRHPATSMACDCGATAGPASHPRYYGSFPRVLGRYVREQKVMSWHEAVHKMTGLPAATIGLVDRGLLAPGMKADIVLFDPATIIDRATFERPTSPSEGVRHVLVNGTFALRDGAVTGARAGRALRRTAHMPSRAFAPAGGRAVSARADGFTVDIAQARRAAVARGSLRFTVGDTRYAATELGAIQVAAGWASITGVVRNDSGELRAVTVIVDGEGDDGPVAVLQLEGGEPLVLRANAVRVDPGVPGLRRRSPS